MNSRQIIKCCYAHHQHVLNNKEYFLTESAITSMQYMNYTAHATQMLLIEAFYSELKKINKHTMVFLNFCIGPAFLELMNKLNKNALKLSSVEFEPQVKWYEAIRKYYDVDQINYVCNDFNSENFEIKKCKTNFNYVILKDFVPFWKIHNLKDALLKFKIYAKKIALLEKDSNLTETQHDFLILKSFKIINIMEDWKLYLIKSNTLDENV